MTATMPQTFTIAREGVAETYRYQIGGAQWGGQEADVVVIQAFPIEEGKDVSIDPAPLRNGILAQHPELKRSARPLAVVIKNPTGLAVAKWRLVSFWGDGSGPDLRLRSYEMFEADAAELERVFGP